MSTRAARARLGAAIVVAFVCGLVFASGFNLTRFGWAQGRVNGSAATKPTPAQIAPAADLESAFEAVADHARPAVVSIDIEKFAKPVSRPRIRGRNGQPLPPGIEDFFRNFDGPQSDLPEEASGSGFIVSPDGYILTNNHVVADADKVMVTLYDKRVFSAKVVGRDSTTDVAVIKIDAGNNMPTLSLGDDNSARVGQWVLAIGNPLGLDFTVTAGIVSAKGRSRGLSDLLNRNNQNPYAITDYIQTDAAINPGNSGGPLLNIHGDVIGINSAIASGTGYYNGYGFAIPITLARDVMNDLIKYGKIERGVVGVSLQEVQPADAAAAHLTQVGGAKVSGFPSEDGPAQKAGIEEGDIIVAAAGHPVDQVATLQRIIRSYKPGQTVDLDVIRRGEKKTFHVTLAAQPSQASTVAITDDETPSGRNAPSGAAHTNDKLGITVEPLSSSLAQEEHVPAQYRNALRIVSVAANGPAFHQLGPEMLIVGELAPTRRPIRSVDDLQAAVAPLKNGEAIMFNVLACPGNQACATSAISVQVQK